MRTERAILKRVKFWKDNPMLVSGVYRLFIYLDWSSIPEEYHEFFQKSQRILGTLVKIHTVLAVSLRMLKLRYTH